MLFPYFVFRLIDGAIKKENQKKLKSQKASDQINRDNFCCYAKNEVEQIKHIKEKLIKNKY